MQIMKTTIPNNENNITNLLTNTYLNNIKMDN